jgi:hypothetical protein
MADATPVPGTSIGDVIAAVAALGVASMGLVDALKVFGRWGPSNVGFGEIRDRLTPFLPAAPVGAYNRDTLLLTLRANWINGVDKSQQKAKAKSLIHLGLSKGNAAGLAQAAGVDPALLQSLAEKTAAGGTATPPELNALGQFDAILSAVLDAAYERADQKYRNFCKALATCFAVVLALIAAYYIGASWVVALIAGIAAVPLAPASKDLVTSLQAAAAAVQKTNRVKV